MKRLTEKLTEGINVRYSKKPLIRDGLFGAALSEYGHMVLDKLGEYEDLEEEGRLIVLDENSKSDVEFNDSIAENVWDFVKKIYNMDAKEIEECFMVHGGFYDVIRLFSVNGAMETYKEWVEEKIMNVGDVVEYDGVYGAIVDIDRDIFYVLTENGTLETLESSDMTKTKHSIDLTDIFKKLEELNSEE